MDELLYTINSSLGGTGTDMIIGYCKSCIVPLIIIMAVLAVFSVCYKKYRRNLQKVLIFVLVTAVATFGLSFGVSAKRLNVVNYMSLKKQYSDFVENEYVNPGTVKLTFPEKKRNLIYIFLESMEMTYADKENGGGFEENCIPELTKLSEENENFSGTNSKLNGGYTVGASTWTMGAMFAQTSGLSLMLSIEGNLMSTQEHFFPEITTLGDILEQEGYNQPLMIGSDAGFGGRDLYFTEHGNYDIFDYNTAKEEGLIPEDYYVWWGYEDQKLFEYAKQKLTDLSSNDEPFNFTMLTVDTHFEDGYVCEQCTDEFGDNQYANVMACSSRQVAAFVEWIQQQDFYEDTTIVICGDHLTMDSDFCNNVDSNYNRRVYTAYINPEAESTGMERTYSTYDNFPTTLAAMGVEIEGNRLGLGTNLFSDTPTLLEKYGLDEVSTELSKKSYLIDNLANINEDLIPDEQK